MNPETRTFHTEREMREIRRQQAEEGRSVNWLEFAPGERFCWKGWWWELVTIKDELTDGHGTLEIKPVVAMTRREKKAFRHP